MRMLLIAVTAFASVSAGRADAGESRLWRDFVRQADSGEATDLPDFSYAGYARGEADIAVRVERRFPVTDYGAVPDDDGDDREAIQKAVDAASAAGGGVVFFPPGRFIVNSTRERIDTVYIKADNVVLKGSGSGRGGTIIHQIHPFRNGAMDDYTRVHLKRSIIEFVHPGANRNIRTMPDIAKVTADSARGTFSVTLDDAAPVGPGDNVYLFAMNKETFLKEIRPLGVDPKWTNIEPNTQPSMEIHQVKSVDGNVVTFAEPLYRDVGADEGWRIRKAELLSHVGVEDIAFEGNAYALYFHHRSDRDDVGWSFIRMKGVVDSWVRRCVFANAGQLVYTAQAARTSMLNLVVDGEGGHHIPRAGFFSTAVLGAFIRDRAGYSHGPSINGGVAGTVFYECSSPGAPDSHAGRPVCTLYDCNVGGAMRSSGGLRDYPQHLKGFVLWNYENTDPRSEYDFWRSGTPNRFVKPAIVGFHGEPAKFNAATVGVMESYGKAVSPRSLYEAQVARRLGRLPAWIDAARKEEADMLARELGDWFDRRRPEKKGYQYIAPFKVGPLAQELCELSMTLYNSVPFTLSMDAEAERTEITADEVLLSHVLYMMMNVAYRGVGSAGNGLAVERLPDGGARFTVTSGAPKPDKKVDRAVGGYLDEAVRLAKILGRTVEVADGDEGRLVLRLDMPAGKNGG